MHDCSRAKESQRYQNPWKNTAKPKILPKHKIRSVAAMTRWGKTSNRTSNSSSSHGQDNIIIERKDPVSTMLQACRMTQRGPITLQNSLAVGLDLHFWSVSPTSMVVSSLFRQSWRNYNKTQRKNFWHTVLSLSCHCSNNKVRTRQASSPA